MLTTIPIIPSPRMGRSSQKVVVVNGSREILELLESVLDAGHYDVVFVADTARAYSQIKQNRPNLVILSMAMDDPIGFQVLSMLKLDEETASIPVLTYTGEAHAEKVNRDEPADEEDDEDEELQFTQRELPLN
jgi:PleD family two-component response regulator